MNLPFSHAEATRLSMLLVVGASHAEQWLGEKANVTHNSYLHLHIIKTEPEAPSLSSKQLILALNGVLFIMLKQKYLKVANSKNIT